MTIKFFQGIEKEDKILNNFYKVIIRLILKFNINSMVKIKIKLCINLIINVEYVKILNEIIIKVQEYSLLKEQ